MATVGTDSMSTAWCCIFCIQICRCHLCNKYLVKERTEIKLNFYEVLTYMLWIPHGKHSRVNIDIIWNYTTFLQLFNHPVYSSLLLLLSQTENQKGFCIIILLVHVYCYPVFQITSQYQEPTRDFYNSSVRVQIYLHIIRQGL